MRAGVILTAAAIAAAIAGAPASAGAAPPVTEHQVASGPGAVAAAAEYWTKSRLRHADPLSVSIKPSGVPRLSGSASPADAGSTPDPAAVPPFSGGEIADPTTPQYRTNGKVFFHDPSDGNNYECSGTAVDSPNRSVVLTAGHCVYYGSFSTNFVFIPGYHDGVRPFGTWAATNLSAPGGWTSSFDCPGFPDNCPNFDYDVGAAVVAQNSGQNLEDVVGAAGVAFNQPRNATYDAYGYPADAPFDGESLHTCHSPLGGSDTADPRGGPAPIWIGCDMNAGSSGGGWLVGPNRESHNDYSYSDEPDQMYGPYYGDDAEAVYDGAAGITPPPGPASRPAAPDTKLTGHPKRRGHKRKAKFQFATADGSLASFRCRLDGDPWASCSKGRVTYRHLGFGRHSFEVAATTAASGDDASPATYSFRVKRAR